MGINHASIAVAMAEATAERERADIKAATYANKADLIEAFARLWGSQPEWITIDSRGRILSNGRPTPYRCTKSAQTRGGCTLEKR